MTDDTIITLPSEWTRAVPWEPQEVVAACRIDPSPARAWIEPDGNVYVMQADGPRAPAKEVVLWLKTTAFIEEYLATHR